MSKRAYALIILCLGILLSSVVYSEDVTVNHKAINDEITKDQTATFTIKITNDQEFDDIFKLVFNDLRWSASTEPLTHFATGINIKKGATESTKLILKPNENIKTGYNYIELVAKSKTTGKEGSDILLVYVKPIEEIANEADITTTAIIPEMVDPRRDFSIKIYIDNNNPVDLKNISIDITSDLINKHANVDVGPNNKTSAEFTVSLEDNLKPQKINLDIIVQLGNKTLADVQKEIEIISITPKFARYITTEKGFLRFVSKVDLTNIGNVRKTEIIKIEKPMISWFISTEPKAQAVKEDKTRYYSWEIELEPGETKSIAIKRDYRLLFIILVVAIVLVLMFHATKDPVKITKTIKGIKTKEGSISEMKIILTIKNLRNKPIEDVTIIDRLPHIVHLDTAHEEGTLKPTKTYQHERHGLVLNWKLPELEAREERIIKYNIKAKLNIVGSIRLKPAIIKFGKTEVFSNSLSFGC